MKLRKMVTVSAAALMLAGVGASATNVGAPVHASRRTARISNLRGQSRRLNSQIKSDKYQIKNINNELAKLTRKNNKNGKRSKKSTKRNSSKKINKKNKRNKKNQKKTNKKSAAQQQAIKNYMAASKKLTPIHIQINGKVYNAKVNGLNQIVSKSKKPLMSVKAYNAKNKKALANNQKTISQLSTQFNKIHSKKNKMKFLQSKKVKRAVAESKKLNVFPVQAPKAQNAKK